MKIHKLVLAVFSLFIVSPALLSHARGEAQRSASESTESNVVLQDWQDAERSRKIPVKIYLPTSGTAPYPVVIFSHGLGGSREAAQYLGEYWSAHGYVGLFVQHAGSDTGVWQSSAAGGRQAILQQLKTAANGKNLLDRTNDIKFVLDQLEKRNQNDSVLKNQLDLRRIALAGHSFGAGTTLAVAGQSFGGLGKGFDMSDPRVKAALYLCPPIMGGKSGAGQNYSNIQIPGMLLTGTEDASPISDTKPADRRIPFDGIKSPHQYLVNFVGADHSVFGGRAFRSSKEGDDKFHEQIDVVTTKFLDATLKGDRSASQWLDKGGIESFLGKTAMVERK